MKTAQRQPVPGGRRGAALVMVVVLTVLLAGIGTLFVMVSRLDEMATSSITCERDLDNAVQSAVDLISLRLAEDVPMQGVLSSFGDQPGRSVDWWLAPLVPGLRDDRGTPGDYTDDLIYWEHVSDITGQITAAKDAFALPRYLRAMVYDAAYADDLLPADADGDGVIDSYWVRLPFLNTSRGKPVFAAVRIVDNCAMLNLNTASHIPDTSDPSVYVWPDMEGRYLSSVDYRRFLRGDDRLFPDRIQLARQRSLAPLDPPDYYHHEAIMRIERPSEYALFDIADELEMRNRFMLTSLFQARFEREDVAYETFDYERGQFGGGWNTQLRVRRIPYDNTNFDLWIARLDPNNFDDNSGAVVDNYKWMYDRRHVCTFYSFDRNLRFGVHPSIDVMGNVLRSVFPPDPLAVSTSFGVPVWNIARQEYVYEYNNTETRVQILKLLYAFRAYYLARNQSSWDYTRAARSACQFVANMIDYIDDNNPLTEGPFFDGTRSPFTRYGGQRNPNPTFINRAVIRELIMEVSEYLSDGQNIIDIGDTYDPDNPYEFGIGSEDINETVYGYERQPFISEIVRHDDNANRRFYAIELCNPYDKPISIEGWRLKIGTNEFLPFISSLDPSGDVHVPAATGLPANRVLGRRVIVSNNVFFIGELPSAVPHYEIPQELIIPGNEVVELQRLDPSAEGEYITVDRTRLEQSQGINTDTAPQTFRSSKRDDTKWRFTKADSYVTNNTATLKSENNTGEINTRPAFQLPVADNNKPIGTLLDFARVLLVGNERVPDGTMKPITEHVAFAGSPLGGEKEMRMDVLPRQATPWSPRISPLDYVCFMGRPEGSLPGRININTATMEVIRAAIRDHADVNTPIDNEALARNIVQSRYYQGLPRPYRRITELLERDIGFTEFVNNDPNVGDPEMAGDFEERDWILSQVANLFTVRSDVFTGHILVRLGHDGPQRRMIAIFDRTNVSRDPLTGLPTAKPRIVALHPVPDPR